MNLARVLPLLALLAMSACTASHQLAVCKGPLFALNPGRWQPTPADLTLAKGAK